MTDEAELLESLGSAGMMAFIWNNGGEGDLRKLLETLITDGTGSVASRQSKKTLEADAAKLIATGFEGAADIVLQYLDSVPTERELLCPYTPEDRANYTRWQASELSLKVGDGGNREGGISWGCLTPPLLHQRSDMPCPTITSSS